jgi:hypothetical protein
MGGVKVLTTLIGTTWSADAPDFHFKMGRGVPVGTMILLPKTCMLCMTGNAPTGKDLLESLWQRELSLVRIWK